LVTQLSRVLLFSPEDISRTRPLPEMGLDSLMALEFTMNLEEIFGIQLSLTRSGSTNLNSLTSEIIALATSESDIRVDAAVAKIVEHHITDPESRQVEIVSELLRGARSKMGGIAIGSQKFPTD
jgi:phthiocerol/phenolphthiocerol synthesis type-I polyketide synthase C